MRAAIYDDFQQLLDVRNVPDPEPPRRLRGDRGARHRIVPERLARLDGHDADIKPPHVPGHELSDVVEAVGPNVTKWRN